MLIMDLFYSVNEGPFAFRSQFKFLPDHIRGIYYWTILTICFTAIIANVLAIRSTIRGKHRFVQKTCIVCLAISDVFGAIMAGIACREELSHDILIWTLGKFMCGFVPMGNTIAIMSSSLGLSVIALDRYQNVMSALTTMWDPSPLSCIGIALALLFFSCVISYPLFIYFELRAITLVTFHPYSKEKFTFELIHYCGALVKERLTVYYVLMAFIIFFPLILIFSTFYLNIAILIWKHRKPVSSADKSVAVGEDTSTYSTKRSYSSDSTICRNVPKRKNIQVERKIRTFRTVLLLMISFIVCRLPYWLFYVVRLLTMQTNEVVWNVHYSLISLNLLNCILDPLLYTFLHETINALKVINDFLFKICCFWFSNDFEDFEKNNPFVIEDNYKFNIQDAEKINVTPLPHPGKLQKKC